MITFISLLFKIDEEKGAGNLIFCELNVNESIMIFIIL